VSEGFCACMMTPPGTSDGLRTGTPFPIAEVRLLDPQGGEAAPGEPGVLWLRHPAQARGYANLPEETRAQFRDGWFCSRDLFVRDAQGFYVHQGRADELVKVAGQWVWPAELEQAALAAAGVAEAACVPVPDGEGLHRLALFVTGQENAASAAHAACERLPRYKRPKWIRAVSELPRTATGKVQRYKLREILERELGASG
jgi:3-hydroxybenzoate/4-hydroxybenzoate---CoA ligase